MKMLSFWTRLEMSPECLLRFGDKVREVKLRWFGQVQRRDNGQFGQNLLQREHPQERMMDAMKVYLQRIGATEEHAGMREMEADDSLWKFLKRAENYCSA